MIGQEDVKLSGKQIDELVSLIDKEELLENEEKIEKALAKSKEQREQLQKQKDDTEPGAERDAVDTAPTIGKTEDEKHVLQDKSVSPVRATFRAVDNEPFSRLFQLDDRIDGKPIPPGILKGHGANKESSTQSGR